MRLLYNLFIKAYPLAAQLIRGKNEKAAQWLRGRVGIFDRLEQALAGNDQPIVWVHAASLGEFEQGRPLMEKIRATQANTRILLTFFSPSGYEIRKDYDQADWVFYLPMDGQANAHRFFTLVQPKVIFFIKYDFWHYYLQEAKARQVPLFLVSAVFRSNQPFFAWYGAFHRNMLHCFTHFFVQNNQAKELLASIGIRENVSISGDTRFDRVIEIAAQFSALETIELFLQNATKVIVAGSTWTEDDEELDHFANTRADIKFIIAPHNIDAENIAHCLKLYQHAVLFSQFKANPHQYAHSNCLIIDNVGMLSKLYHYATICYVGGAFGNDGVHNVLEAAVYYKPVVFGPEYAKYQEAIDLVACGGGFSIDAALDLEALLEQLLIDEKKYQQACAAAGTFVYAHAGATAKILEQVQLNRLLTR